jgi:protein TonB
LYQIPNRYQAGAGSINVPLFGPMPIGLAVAVAVSVLLHVVLLSVHFALPDWRKAKSTPQTLEVVLVNSKSKTKPVKSQVLAQANLDGGGNVDEDRRAKTPLPVTPNVEKGDDVQRAQRRVRQLEAEQRKLMAAAKSKKSIAATEEKRSDAPTPAPTPSGLDLRDSALMAARMEAQLSERIEEYNKRPRKTFIGTRAREARFAMYVEAWRQKVERIGNNNYPDSARGRIYGSLRMTVAIRPDGSIDSMQIDRSSGQAILDHAAEKIVRLAAPFAPFPDNIRKDTDIMVITRTWTFAPGDKLFGD